MAVTLNWVDEAHIHYRNTWAISADGKRLAYIHDVRDGEPRDRSSIGMLADIYEKSPKYRNVRPVDSRVVIRLGDSDWRFGHFPPFGFSNTKTDVIEFSLTSSRQNRRGLTDGNCYCSTVGEDERQLDFATRIFYAEQHKHTPLDKALAALEEEGTTARALSSEVALVKNTTNDCIDVWCASFAGAVGSINSEGKVAIIPDLMPFEAILREHDLEVVCLTQ